MLTRLLIVSSAFTGAHATFHSPWTEAKQIEDVQSIPVHLKESSARYSAITSMSAECLERIRVRDNMIAELKTGKEALQTVTDKLKLHHVVQDKHRWDWTEDAKQLWDKYFDKANDDMDDPEYWDKAIPSKKANLAMKEEMKELKKAKKFIKERISKIEIPIARDLPEKISVLLTFSNGTEIGYNPNEWKKWASKHNDKVRRYSKLKSIELWRVCAPGEDRRFRDLIPVGERQPLNYMTITYENDVAATLKLCEDTFSYYGLKKKNKEILKLTSVYGWGGPPTKDEKEKLSEEEIRNLPRSPFDQTIKEGDLYFKGSSEDVKRLLDMFRDNIVNVVPVKPKPSIKRRLLDARIERFIRESIRCENSP